MPSNFIHHPLAEVGACKNYSVVQQHLDAFAFCSTFLYYYPDLHLHAHRAFVSFCVSRCCIDQPSSSPSCSFAVFFFMDANYVTLVKHCSSRFVLMLDDCATSVKQIIYPAQIAQHIDYRIFQHLLSRRFQAGLHKELRRIKYHTLFILNYQLF